MITIDSLTVRYGPQTVLDNLTMHLSERSVHGLVGVNGAGKTTLFDTFFGLITPRQRVDLPLGPPSEAERNRLPRERDLLLRRHDRARPARPDRPLQPLVGPGALCPRLRPARRPPRGRVVGRHEAQTRTHRHAHAAEAASAARRTLQRARHGEPPRRPAAHPAPQGGRSHRDRLVAPARDALSALRRHPPARQRPHRHGLPPRRVPPAPQTSSRSCSTATT